LGFFADLDIWVSEITNQQRKRFRYRLAALMLEGIHEALTKKAFPNIAVIEFPDFSNDGMFTPKKEWTDLKSKIRIVKGKKRDTLLWTDEEKEKFVLGTLNPGDCFSIPGNEFNYGSVEAMIGNNTSMRLDQAYFHNPYLLDAKRYIPV
jgi:hypothetical protein